MKFPLALLRVSGDSMLPHYRSGDLVVGWRWFRPRVGQAIVLRSDRLMLKRLAAMSSGQIWVEGDNPIASTDSRSFGFLPQKLIEAKILARIWRPSKFAAFASQPSKNQ